MKRIMNIATLLAGICTLNVHADATLTFELDTPAVEPRTKIISVARFFARIDDPAQPGNYLLYQAGKFFPLYQVDQPNRNYTQLTPEVNPTLHAGPKPEKQATQAETPAARSQETAEKTAAQPEASDTPLEQAAKETLTKAETTAASEQQAATQAPAEASEPAAPPPEDKPETTLHLTPKSKEVGGIQCRVVEERLGKKPIIQHCMADKARLGITEREIRTLARTFKMARERDLGWLGTATKDEKFVSIASEDLSNQKTLELQSLSTKPLPSAHLRIPRDYTKQPKQE
jgi:hypothetical protein